MDVGGGGGGQCSRTRVRIGMLRLQHGRMVDGGNERVREEMGE